MSHVEELEITIAAARLSGRYAALIELCRVTAKQMDLAGHEPTNRLSAVYLSCLKDLNRGMSGGTDPTPKSPLSKLRAQHGSL